MDKINRMAANFGIDEAFAAAVQEHLKTIGAIPDDAPVEAKGEGVDLAGAARIHGRGERARDIACGVRGGLRIFLLESLVTH